MDSALFLLTVGAWLVIAHWLWKNDRRDGVTTGILQMRNRNPALADKATARPKK